MASPRLRTSSPEKCQSDRHKRAGLTTSLGRPDDRRVLRDRRVADALIAHSRDTDASTSPASPTLYSQEQIAQPLALVAAGKSLHETGAAVGATHTTVLRWRRRAASRSRTNEPAGARRSGRRGYRALPGAAGRDQAGLRGELAHDRDREGVRDGAAGSGAGEEGHGRVSL
jgi:hypothetical protein